jgi:ubiquinone/menaquinone biosynthesis C-methylase UbiE
MESPAEGDRLELKTDASQSRHQLTLTGLGPGMRGLDAGCGSGAVARVMAEIVGPRGSILAVDASSDRVEQGRRLAAQSAIDNLAFARADLRQGPVESDAFDFVWSRFLFEYLDDPDQILTHLVASVRIGGKIVVGDLDGNGVIHYPTTPEFDAGLEQLVSALKGRFDPCAGRKLFNRFRKQHLASIRVHALPYHLYAGTISEREMVNWVTKFQTLAPIGHQAFGGREAYERWVGVYLDHLRDPDIFTYSTLLLVEGTRSQ